MQLLIYRDTTSSGPHQSCWCATSSCSCNAMRLNFDSLRFGSNPMLHFACPAPNPTHTKCTQSSIRLHFTGIWLTRSRQRRWCSGQHGCVPNSRSGFDSRPAQGWLRKRRRTLSVFFLLSLPFKQTPYRIMTVLCLPLPFSLTLTLVSCFPSFCRPDWLVVSITSWNDWTPIGFDSFVNIRRTTVQIRIRGQFSEYQKCMQRWGVLHKSH